ncbi:MAG: lysophospholipid acyltransferase family protein [Proteobacteria bacterium]|jgi:putative hemolysin|nr:lysophospholipid acyltransferase family protein [Pseudomonadota bacterium]
MTISLDDPLFKHFLEERPTLTYAEPTDPWLARHLIRTIENVFGRRKVQKLYDTLKSQPFELTRFFEDAVAQTRIDLRYDSDQLNKIPSCGPLVMVANHPFGVMDGTILCHFAAQARGDFRILINALLCRDKDLAPHFLPVDFSSSKAAMKNNVAMGRRAREAIAADIPVLIFPSGFVSTANRFGIGQVVDAPWTTFAAKLISDARANVVPVFFHGQNSRSFHIASHLSESLRMALLIREAQARFGTRFDVTIGDTLPYEALEGIKGRKALTHYLYDAVQKLGEAQSAGVG